MDDPGRLAPRGGHAGYSFANVWIPSDPTAWPPLPEDTQGAAAAVAGVRARAVRASAAILASMATASEAVTVDARLTQRGHILSDEVVHLKSGQPGALRIKPSRRARRGAATLTLIARDAGGNATKITRTVKIRR